jgi:alkylhydroperoxidase family enzyme
MQLTIGEQFYTELANYRRSDLYSEREKLAVEYAERFALDHLNIDDELFERLLAHFTDAEVLDLSVTVARHLGFGRMTQVLRVDQVCPIQ